jgi:hypothetical protein
MVGYGGLFFARLTELVCCVYAPSGGELALDFDGLSSPLRCIRPWPILGVFLMNSGQARLQGLAFRPAGGTPPCNHPFKY